MLNLKTKIYGGLGILIIIIFFLSVFGVFFLKQLSDDSSSIIKDNYHSIDYSFLMLKELDNIYNIQNSIAKSDYSDTLVMSEKYSQLQSHLNKFSKVLSLQKNNITEVNEDELVKRLTDNFNSYQTAFDSLLKNNLPSHALYKAGTYNSIRNTIHEIYKLNMQSIIRKSDKAKKTSGEAITYMVIMSSISLVVILFYIFRFPNYLISPINELTNKIRAISTKSFDQKIIIKTNDEIGELTESFNIMAARLKEYDAQHLNQLLLEKKRIESLVYGLNDGVILLDERNNIILINTAAQKILKLNIEEALNNNLHSLAVQSAIVSKVVSAVFPTEKKSENNSELIEIIDGEIKEYFGVDAIEIKRKNDLEGTTEIKGLVIILKNVTAFKEKDIAKTNLLATVSHELKTPISSINLSLKLIKDARLGSLNIEQKKLIESITQQNKRLLRVVNDLLEYSQVETGKIILHIEAVEPFKIVDLATSALMILFTEKDIILESNIDENLPLIKADIEKSVWILVNILSNAIRYSPPKGVILLSIQKENNFIRFSVLDHGPGISDSDKNKIFQKYIKDKDGYFKGTGLGLSIAKEFVESQEGKIWFDSSYGSGSQFHFTLPIA